jgi:hypothetical protein
MGLGYEPMTHSLYTPNGGVGIVGVLGNVDQSKTAKDAKTAKGNTAGRVAKRRKPSTANLCPTCDDELAVRWRGRWWCVTCDESEQFPKQKV